MQTIDKQQVRFDFNPQAQPRAYADSGETVRFICQDCYAEQLTRDGLPFSEMDMTRNNPISGPLFIREAQPGDILRVQILNIELNEEGCMCVRTGKGIYEVEGAHCRRFPVRDGMIWFDNGIRIPIRPMIGVIGTSPARDPESTQSPGEHGGNLDIKDMGIGATLYLPVTVPGALLSMGDLHAIQGDGETAICGMEMGGVVTVKVDVLKNAAYIPTPFLVNATHCYTTAADPSLDVCSVAAALKMQRFLMHRANLTDAQAAMLLSLVGNLRISQVVNPKKGCIMELPLNVVALQPEME